MCIQCKMLVWNILREKLFGLFYYLKSPLDPRQLLRLTCAPADLEQAKREAEMHAERKQQAWNEAQEAGKGGASMEGSHLSSLKDKIKDMAVSSSSVF